MTPENVKNIAKVLAVLIAERGEYTYVDKLGYAPSKDLVFYYLREALRDLHSLMRTEIKNSNVRNMLNEIDFNQVERVITDISRIESKRELREITSMITSYALNFSASLIKKS